jgi:signal transduction histidine kinase/DNA-binding NarL/FixJ family response regulator
MIKRHHLRPCLGRLLGLLLVLCAMVTGAAANEDPEAKRSAIIRELDYDPAAGVERSEHELAAARQRGDKRAELDALLKLSISHAVVADTEKPRETEAAGEALARELGDDHTLLWFVERRAWVLWGQGHIDQADQLWNENFAMADRHGWVVRKAWMLINRGAAYNTTGRKGDGLALLEKSYEMFESQGDKVGMAMALIYTGDCIGGSQATGADNTEAADFYARALGLIDVRVYRLSYMKALLRLGQAHLRISRLEDALKELQQARQLAQTLHSRSAEFDASVLLAETQMQLGRPADALAGLTSAMAMQTGTRQDQPQVLRAQLDSAILLGGLGKRREAEAMVADARATLNKRETPFSRELFESKASEAYAALGDLAQAYAHSQAARDAARQLRDAERGKLAEEYRARFEVRLKETENALLRSREREAEYSRRLQFVIFASVLLVLSVSVLLLRKRAQVARQAAEHSRSLAEAAAAASDAKTAFVSSMSHELRSPLNAMLGFCRLLMRDPQLGEQARRDVAIVLRSGEQLYTLINQVLDLSKLEAARSSLNPAPLEIRDLLDELHTMFSISAAERGLELNVVETPDVPRRVRVDAVKLRQVLVNLLSNALKFTQQGSVTLHVGFEAGRLRFEVVDTGVGIAEQELPELGVAFTQAEAGRRSGEGTGLGLALSRGFVQLMGGELSLHSTVGVGTRAGFDIPVELLSATAEPLVSAPGRLIGHVGAGPAPRILAVDDRAEGRHLLVRMLTPLGFEVREAANGKEAVELWRQWNPALILMDIRMPVMDGREATRRIRQAEAGASHTCIVALTASTFEEERQELLALGCDDFLHKPFREEALLQTLARHLGLVYEQEQAARDATGDPDPRELHCHLAALPLALRERLGAALQRLDVEAIEHAVQAIRVHDEATAWRIAPLLERFQYATLNVALKHLDDAPVPATS